MYIRFKENPKDYNKILIKFYRRDLAGKVFKYNKSYKYASWYVSPTAYDVIFMSLFNKQGIMYEI